MRRRGRPGLMGTVARTAVIAGTASATANAVNRRAQNRAAEQDQAAADQAPAADQAAAAPPDQPAPPPAAATGAPPGDLVSQLTDLAKLRDAGVLSSEEFDAAKAKLLAS
jgi:hypothetical protein